MPKAKAAKPLLKLWPFFVSVKVSLPADEGDFDIKSERHLRTPKGHLDVLTSLSSPGGRPVNIKSIDKIYRQSVPSEVLERQRLYDGLSYSSKRQYAPERQL